uniref:Elongation factor 1-beta n=1 Tax=Ciona savignyi TaxID=51511 RepID=H2ZMC3_CIOSA
MGFGNLKTDAGVTALNNFLADKSYIDGYVPSQVDVVVFQAMSGAPAASFSHALRWYNHIKSYQCTFASLPGVKKPVDDCGPKSVANGVANDDDDEDDDDVDLFGSDEEEESEADKKIREDRLAAYAAKKSKKPALTAKSNIILDVKPWGDETDMAELEKCVRSVQADGLLWGASKLVAIGYGIKKLQISCVVEDDKISTDFLEEEITKYEDLVQSMDIAAFNKV